MRTGFWTQVDSGNQSGHNLMDKNALTFLLLAVVSFEGYEGGEAVVGCP
jgi:hypothetical protein